MLLGAVLVTGTGRKHQLVAVPRALTPNAGTPTVWANASSAVKKWSAPAALIAASPPAFAADAT
jgi:hypothetical protein